jgi:hypothetical protein
MLGGSQAKGEPNPLFKHAKGLLEQYGDEPPLYTILVCPNIDDFSAQSLWHEATGLGLGLRTIPMRDLVYRSLFTNMDSKNGDRDIQLVFDRIVSDAYLCTDGMEWQSHIEDLVAGVTARGAASVRSTLGIYPSRELAVAIRSARDQNFNPFNEQDKTLAMSFVTRRRDVSKDRNDGRLTDDQILTMIFPELTTSVTLDNGGD